MKLDLQKILEYFNSFNDRARLALLTGAALLAILLYVVILGLPQMAGIGAINAQVRKLSEGSQQVLIDKQRYDLYGKSLEIARYQLGSLNVKVRPIQEVPAILSTISSIAREYGVKIDQLVPEYSQQETLTASAEGKYFALPIEVKARCGYHMFGHFLNKLENEDLYFILKDFIIQNDEKDPKTHLFSLTIKIVLVDKGHGAS